MKQGVFRILGVAPAVLAVAFCWRIYARPVHIRQIALDPGRLNGRVVTVRGVVAPCFRVPPVGWGIFCLDDGTGKVLVVTDREVPEQGRRASARGRVQRSKAYGMVVVAGRGKLE